MRTIGIALVGLTLGAAQAGSKPGYLPIVGPAPLRFQSASPGRLAALPPLVEHETAPATEASGADATAAEPAPANQEALGPHAPASHERLPMQPGLTNPVGPESVLPAVNTNTVPIITPQMLMQFFLERGLTNRNDAPVDPIIFSPAPPPAPSSSATYISEPKP